MIEGRLVDQKDRYEDKQLGRKGLTRKKKKRRGKKEGKKGKKGKKRIRGIDKALESSVVGGLVGDKNEGPFPILACAKSSMRNLAATRRLSGLYKE